MEVLSGGCFTGLRMVVDPASKWVRILAECYLDTTVARAFTPGIFHRLTEYPGIVRNLQPIYQPSMTTRQASVSGPSHVTLVVDSLLSAVPVLVRAQACNQEIHWPTKPSELRCT